MSEICNSFENQVLQYGPIHVDKATCEMFVPCSAQVIAGYMFADAHKNYQLLSKTDFTAFHKHDAARIHETQRSPFGRIIVILYCDNNCYRWKIVNGMASNLIPACESWATSMNAPK